MYQLRLADNNSGYTRRREQKTPVHSTHRVFWRVGNGTGEFSIGWGPTRRSRLGVSSLRSLLETDRLEQIVRGQPELNVRLAALRR